MDGDMRKLSAICAIAKNEGPYLAEWAIYHRMIGFDHILIYNNESSDDSEAVLSRLADAGIVEYRNWPTSNNGRTQKLAYADGLANLRDKFQWISYIDIDEFIYVPGFDNNIKRFLESYRLWDAIAINWKIFGTSGKENHEDGLVIERFTQCALTGHSGNRAVKTLCRTDKLVTPNLHNHTFSDGVVYATVEKEIIPPGIGKSENVSHNIIRIHHYFTKSREEWDRKVARGRATKPINHPEKFRKEDHFKMHNKNEDVDTSLSIYSSYIRDYLLYIPK